MNRLGHTKRKSKAVCTAELLHQTPTDTAERKEINTDSRYIQAASGTFNREEEEEEKKRKKKEEEEGKDGPERPA